MKGAARPLKESRTKRWDIKTRGEPSDSLVRCRKPPATQAS